MIVDSLVELIGQTPMLRLNRLAAGLDAEVLAKLEMFNPYSLKDRPALRMIEEAERAGRLTPGATLVEASSGNAGVALTYIGRLRGYRVVICMSELMSDEHKQVLRALGAELVLTPAELGIRGSRERARELADSLPSAIYMEQHFNPANAKSHRETTAEEIWHSTEGRIDIFVHGLGSCGTVTGVAQALKERKPSLRFVAIEPQGAALMSQGEFKAHRLLGIGPGFVPGLFEPELIDEIVTASEKDAFAMCREIAAKEGLLVGITSGASAHVALELARRPENRGKTIVTIFADAGQGYLSVEGLFDIEYDPDVAAPESGD
jgi:cysteine synthase A